MKRIEVLIFCIVCFVSAFEARGQRTMKAQPFFDLSLQTSFTSFGGELSYGQYTMHGYWTASADFLNRHASLVDSGGTSCPVDYSHAVAQGFYMYRLFSDMSRRFCFYGGAGVFLGAEIVDIFNKKPNGGHIPVSNCFLYGIQPRLSLELFVTDRTALIFHGGLPINFSSEISRFGFLCGIGARFNFESTTHE